MADIPSAMLTSSPVIDEVSVETVDRAPPNVLLLDVREPEEFARGHIPDAVNIPQADLATRINDIPRDRPIFTVCQSGMRSLRSAQFLRQEGFENVATVVGGTRAWLDAGKAVLGSERPFPPSRVRDSEWMHAGGATNTTE